MSPLTQSLSEKLVDILATYARAVGTTWPFLAGWAVIFVVLAALSVQIRWASAPRWVRLVGIGLIIAGALAWAIHLASLFDDAYISLRYARNFARGHGLVFNLDERVEGYTNFLWTVLLGIGMKIGLDGPMEAVGGCLIALALELLIVARLSRLMTGKPTPIIPLASVVLSASYTFASFGTSGMETMLSALLLTLALERAVVKSFALSGLFVVLAMMTHPDFALFAAGLGLSILVDRDSKRSIVRYATPIIAIFTPYFLWRWNYYGDVFPNTYYAKSGGLSYFSQGSIYLLASSLASGLWALIPLAVVAMRNRPAHLLTRFTLFGVAPYLFYVAKIGGDFMLGRLLVGVLPVCAVLAELGLRDLIDHGSSVARWIAPALLAFAAAPIHLIGRGDVKWWLSDERTFFSLNGESPVAGSTRSVMLTSIADRGLRPLVGEAMTGMSGYTSDLPMIDELGLTDRTVAHQALTKRGRPGHEKLASPEYLKLRGVLLSFAPLYPDNDLTEVYLNHQAFYLGKYDPALIAAIKTVPNAEVPDLPTVIDEFVLSAKAHIPDTFARDVRFFEEFYFSVNRDPARHDAIRDLQRQAEGH